MRHIKARIKKKKKPLTLLTNTKLLHSKSTYFYKQWDSYLIPAGCAIALLLVLGLSVNPFMSKTDIYALDNDITSPIGASLKLTVGNTSLTKQDAAIGEINYITTSVNIDAANIDGYKVYVQAAPGSSSVLRNSSTEITGVGDSVTTANFGDNKWGYALDSTGASVENLAYTSVPENGATLNPAYSTKATAENKNFNLAFAAKFGSNAVAGHYTTNVLLSAVASANDIVGFDELKLGFSDLTYMQDMTAAKCDAAQIYETKQLIDNRDGKKYWITKLQDGNCWMSQNLDLDLSTTKTLTTADSDVTADWTPVNDTQTGSPSFTTNLDDIQSYNPGEYVYATPSERRDCGSVTSLSQCSNYAWINTAGLVADANPNFTAEMNGDAVNGNKYDSHYHAGNYYSWAAATAGSATFGSKAIDSICPKGWQLPINSTVTGTKSYYSVLREYGVNSKLISTDTVPQYDVRLSPLFFTYGGYIYSNINYLANAGSTGYYWTSTPNGSNGAYNMLLSTAVSPSSTQARFNGLSVRCVAHSTYLTNITNMQDMTTDVCAESKVNESKKLIDKRDGKSYQVTKLKDNNCWMTSNLDLINTTIDSTDSDLESGSFTVPASSISNFTDSNQYSPKAYRYSTYGGYYNWFTATAGTGTSTVTNGDASGSICPKGWRLPPSAGNKSYTTLFNAYGTYQTNTLFYGDQDITAEPLNFTKNGYINNSSRTGTGTLGYYWSSTASSTANAPAAYGLNINGNTVSPSGNAGIYRYWGSSIRCVAR